MNKGVRISTTYDNESFKKVKDKLKSCPFCGKTDKLDILVVDGYKFQIAVECSRCDYELPIEIDLLRNNVDDLINKWNYRPKGVSR